MLHLEDKLAEYVYEELSTAEMAEARQHVAACAGCRHRVEEFQKIQHALNAWPDTDLPQRLVFAPADHVRRRMAVPLRWLAPLAAAAALVLAVFLAGPVHVEWRDSQLTIAFGKLPETRLQALDAKLENITTANAKDIQRVRGELAYVETLQRAFWKETLENATSIQLLARRAELQD